MPTKSPDTFSSPFQLSKSHAPTLSDEVILSVERTARAAFALEAGVVAISVLPGGSSAVYIDDGQYGWATLAFVQDVGETVLVVGKVGEGASALIKLGKLGDKLNDLRKAGAINDKFMHALIAGTQGASAAINGAGAVQAIGEGDGTTAAMRSFDALFSAIGAGAAASKLRKAKAKLDSAISEAIETSQDASSAPKGKIGTQRVVDPSRGKDELAEGLIGTTEQANRIAKAIKNGDIGVNMLGDELFKKAYKLKGGEGSADNIAAFAVGDQIFVRRSSANILSETVHEGTHALDFLRGLPDETTEDLWSLEKRAFFYERQYQRAVGSSVDFASIDEMLEFIFENY